MLSVPSFAKINLSLELLGERPDDMTEIRTIFQSIDLSDTLTVELAPAGTIELSCDDPSIPTGEDNLAVRAARTLLEETGVSAGARIEIRKRIPAGAGLGGGSGNAAVALLVLDRLWRTGLSAEDRHRLAARLGSDVPFFLYGGTALGLGRGDEVYPLADAGECDVLIVLPPFRVSTREAYARARRLLTPRSSSHRIWRFAPQKLAGDAGYSFVVNELEQAVAAEHPLVPALRSRLVGLGAVAAALCGSGSAVFGLFDGGVSERQVSRIEEAARALEAEHAGVVAFRCRMLSGERYRRSIYQALVGEH